MELLTTENIKTIVPIIAAITGLITAIITFMLTSIFTIIREKKKNYIDNRAYFEYGEREMYFPVEQDSIKMQGEGLVLFGPNGSKFKNAEKQGKRACSFMIIHNRTNNDLLNVRIITRYTSKNEIKEEFVLPYWRSSDAIYLFQSEFEESTHYSTNEELTIEFTTKSFERLRFQFKKIKKGEYKEFYRKRFFRFFWRNLLNYSHSDFFTYQTLKIEDK